MRPISRTALGAATAAVLAVTAIAPSVAAPQDDSTAKRPLTGSAAATAEDAPVTVTLVTGDKVLVSTNGSGAASATALPREDGSVPSSRPGSPARTCTSIPTPQRTPSPRAPSTRNSSTSRD